MALALCHVPQDRGVRIMKIYLAGMNAIENNARVSLYSGGIFKRRLFSYYECTPGRYALRQWKLVVAWMRKRKVS